MRPDLLSVMRPPLISFLDNAEGDICEQGRNDTTLWRAQACRKDDTVRQDPGFQELAEQPRHLDITDARTYTLHQFVVIDVVETALDVAFDDPGIRRPLASAIFGFCSRSHAHADMLQGAVAPPTGSEPVGDVPEIRLEDRLQKILHRALYDAVTHGRNAQGAEFPWFSRLGDKLPAGWARLVSAIPQVVTEVFYERLLTRHRANIRDRLPVNPGGAASLVPGNPSPGDAEVAAINDPIPQVSVNVVGICTAPLIEFALNAEEPSLISLITRVHGWFLRLRNPIGSLPAFAMYAAFPRSDYYTGSVP
jgi:hypothetical protein